MEGVTLEYCKNKNVIFRFFRRRKKIKYFKSLFFVGMLDINSNKEYLE